MEEADRDLITLILAAGKGTRMHSDLAKVLHRINGRPMIHYVLDTARALRPRRIIVIVGHQAGAVRRELAGLPGLTGLTVEFAVQEEQLGTGHAVSQAAPLLAGECGVVLVLAGDTPLIRHSTLASLIDAHRRTGAAASVLTAGVDDPTGLGRILRDGAGRIDRIVEEKDASEEQRSIKEINTSTYCFEPVLLLRALDRLTPENRQGEYYLTDTIGILRREGRRIADATAGMPEETMGINTPEQLSAAESWLLERDRARPRDS
ncbi:MAG: NTP transferase domain-containing protein [Gemmatimonadetes bacterium]|nr:NTP transferase domain-containing protein [Gemmatimonadota bacterium]MYG85256.1 NTP transferase domain-containing protein [Gemmatimonadota bacterium]MYJ88923.1 NTP transferase domain-containing protein [Gemmatimonadota bacterium]